MNDDPRSTSVCAVAWDGEFDWPCGRLQQSPNGGCGMVADDPFVAASQHRRYTSAFEGELRVTDRVHTAMKAVEASSPEAPKGPVLIDSRAA